VMHACFADPPYFGCGKKYYSDHPDAALCDTIDWHAELLRRCGEYDAFAYCLTSTTLKDLLPLAPHGTRVAAWVKPFASFKPGVNPAYAWEPVLFRTNAKREKHDSTIRDWVACNIAMKRGLVGAKPAGFCRWIIDLLGLKKTDTLVDLFPGTGIMGKVWDDYCGECFFETGTLWRKGANDE